MALFELGKKLRDGIKNLANARALDVSVVNDLLKEVCNALMSADVNMKLVLALRKNIESKLLSKSAGVTNAMDWRRFTQRVLAEELVTLLDPKTAPVKPVRGKKNVFLFVGLQGAGKTTTVSKLAVYWKRRGFRPGMVCADTFRAGAFDQLAQNATRARVPYYGSHCDADPVAVASKGVATMFERGCDIVLVDTSGRHKQDSALFDEMHEIVSAVEPTATLLVMDGSIGQAALDQATAFSAQVPIGSIIITKLDGHAKGGGALSAVAATRSPITFIGTGESMEELREFDAQTFVAGLLGMADLKSLVTSLQIDRAASDVLIKAQEGSLSLRGYRDLLLSMRGMDLTDVLQTMMPDLAEVARARGTMQKEENIKQSLIILDSMTEEELDDPKLLSSSSRITRIARGSGRSPQVVRDLIVLGYRPTAKMVSGLRKTHGGAHGTLQRQMQTIMKTLRPIH